MPDDDTLRWWLLGSLLVVIAITAYHRIRAYRSDHHLDRRQEGLFILLTLRPTALVFFVGLSLYLSNPARMAWSAVPLPLWVRWTGVAMVGATSALLLWTLHSLGPNLTDTGHVTVDRAQAGESQLDGGFMASPAVSDHALILRSKTHLYRIEQSKGK